MAMFAAIEFTENSIILNSYTVESDTVTYELGDVEIFEEDIILQQR
jgi:hypothetical protein